MHTALQELEILQGSSFALSEGSIAEDESHEETRYAELWEVLHTAYDVSRHNWEKGWQSKGPSRHRLKGHVMESIFFDRVVQTPKSRTATALM
jgi:hypothetical protein